MLVRFVPGLWRSLSWGVWPGVWPGLWRSLSWGVWRGVWRSPRRSPCWGVRRGVWRGLWPICARVKHCVKHLVRVPHLLATKAILIRPLVVVHL